MLGKELFIGRRLMGIRSSHAPYEKISGVVVDESMKTITVDTGVRELRIPKAGNSFNMEFDGRTAWIEGRRVIYRPEDRIKKVR